jgi:hypothetical protein
MRQQGILVPLNEAPIPARKPGVFALANLVHGLVEALR